MTKIRKALRSLMLCVVFVLALLPVQVFAAGAINPSRDVSLTINYIHDKEPIAGVQFDLYRVADVDEYARFTLAGDFAIYPVQVNNLTPEEWKMLAETLSGYVQRDKLTPIENGKTDENGKLIFDKHQQGLKTGLYLAIGETLIKDDYTYTTEPFLVSLPNLDEVSDTWIYDVTAEPKHTREEIPPEPDERTVERRVLKIWKNDTEKLRPGEITVQLLKDGEVYDAVTLNGANNWRHTWEELPEYNADDSKINWSVVEQEPDNYTVLTAREGVTFTVTNTYRSYKPSGGSSNKQKLPWTGLLWWPIPVLACGGLVFLIAGTVNRKKKDHE